MDFALSINYFSQFMQHPRTSHMDVSFSFLCYIRGTIINHVIFISFQDPCAYKVTLTQTVLVALQFVDPK